MLSGRPYKIRLDLVHGLTFGSQWLQFDNLSQRANFLHRIPIFSSFIYSVCIFDAVCSHENLLCTSPGPDGRDSKDCVLRRTGSDTFSGLGDSSRHL